MGSIPMPIDQASLINTPAKGIPYFTPANNGGLARNPEDESLPTLFRPLAIRSVTLKNRIIVAPMCMYSTESDPNSPSIGSLTDYHIAHLGHLAVKGVGLVIIEATAVQPNGRISPNDSGLWQFDQETESAQFKGLKRVVDFIHSQGAKAGLQLAHAGRKASVHPPWIAAHAGVRSLRADADAHGWPDNVVGPTGGEEHAWTRDGVGYWPPRELSTHEVEELVQDFGKSAALAVKAGVDVLEIHAAHGYLINQFLSPVTNRRTDKYGGSYENRVRLLREIAQVIRAVIPSDTPLFLRISATEWLDGLPVAEKSGGSWDMAASLELVRLLPELGIDFLDVSSGGNHEDQKIEPHTDYQIDLAGQLRKAIRAAGATTLVGAVGRITQAEAAEEIIKGAAAPTGEASTLSTLQPKADAILIARQFLREPEWAINAAKKLGVKITIPSQFGRAL